MLDQDDRGAVVIVDVEDEAAHVLLLLDVHAGHRLVEQQDRRLGGECSAQLDALLQPVGQARHRGLADVLDLQELDDFFDRFAVFGSPRVALAAAAARPRGRSRAYADMRPAMMLSSTDMPLNNAMFWNVRAMPSLAARIGVMPSDARRGKSMLPFLRQVDAIDDIEHRALAGAIRSDDGAHLVLEHVEGDVGQRLNAAEPQARSS